MSGPVIRRRRPPPLARKVAERSLLFLIYAVTVAGFATGCARSDVAADLPAALAMAIDEAVPDDLLCAGQVVDLETGRVLFQRSESLRLHPASNVKVIVVAAALWHGLDGASLLEARWRTALFAPTVPGSAWTLVGGGDPLLSEDDLDAVADQILRAGARVTGELHVDGRALPGPHFGAGWMWDDEPAAYMPYLSALTADGGTVTVDLRVAAGVPVTTIRPRGLNVQIESSATVAPPGAASTARIQRSLRGDGRTIGVLGALPESESITRSFSIPDTDKAAGEVLRDRLIARGVADVGLRVARAVDLPPAEHSQAPIAVIEREMEEVLYALLKESDNLSAELLLRRLGVDADPAAPDATAAGLDVVAEYLRSLGHVGDYRIVDGSGLSHLNLVSPELVVDVLMDRLRDPVSAGVLTRCLPIAGVDGTLSSRMIAAAAEGRARAKTGSLSGASALSGFVVREDGGTSVFSWMMNHHVGSSRPWRHLQDRLVDLIAGGDGEPPAERAPVTDVPQS